MEDIIHYRVSTEEMDDFLKLGRSIFEEECNHRIAGAQQDEMIVLVDSFGNRRQIAHVKNIKPTPESISSVTTNTPSENEAKSGKCLVYIVKKRPEEDRRQSDGLGYSELVPEGV